MDGLYIADKMKKTLEETRDFYRQQAEIYANKAKEIDNILEPKEVIEEENLAMDDVEEVQAPVETPRQMVDPNLNNPQTPDLGVQVSAEPVVEAQPSGLTNFKESLEAYPSDFQVVNPAALPVEEKPKKTMFNAAANYNDISIEIVNPHAEQPQAAPQQVVGQVNVPQASVQFGQVPETPVVPGITPGQTFADNTNQNPVI